MKKLLPYLLWGTSIILYAQTTQIPDDNFEQALIDLGHDSGPLDNQVSTSTIEAIKTLNISGKNISDLTGIEAFKNLTSLNASNNNINSINLANKQWLRTLNLDNNNLSSINVNGVQYLEDLSLNNNNLTTLDIGRTIYIESLKANLNNLTSIKLGGYYVNPLTYGGVNRSGKNLLHLELKGNNLTSLDITYNIGLGFLDSSMNQIDEILFDSQKLENLNISKNPLKVLDVSKMSDLKIFKAEETLLKLIDFSKSGRLIKVTIKNNPSLFTIDLKNGNNKKISNGDTNNFIVSGNPLLRCVQVDDPVWSTDNWNIIDNTAWFSVGCKGAPYPQTHVPDDNFEQALIDLGYDTPPLNNYVPTVNLKNLTELNISNKGISNLTGLVDFKKLVNLNASNNNITTVDISNNKDLKRLYLQNNALTSIGLTKFNLFELNVAYNNLTSIDLSNPLNTLTLNSLDVSNNKLTSLNVAKAERLHNLKANNNNLTQVILGGFGTHQASGIWLKNLDLSSNNLSSINLEYNKTLDVLNVKDNNLSSLQYMFGHLEQLYISNNPIVNIDLSNFNQLNTFEAENTQISSLNFTSNKKLAKLVVKNNPHLNSINLKNENNKKIATNDTNNFIVLGNNNLRCVQVDNARWSFDNWKSFDTNAWFSEDCSARVWSGAVNNSWNNVNNWYGETVPGTSNKIIIPSYVNNFPTITSNVTVNSIEINAGAILVNHGTLNGTVTYKRNIPTNNWHLISSPVRGETIQDFIASHQLAVGKWTKIGKIGGNNLGFGTYFNENSVSNKWIYSKAASTGVIATGQGYSLKLLNSGEVTFIGSMHNGNISKAISNAGDANNLLGNPYTAPINSATFLNNNNSKLVSKTIWVWNQATNTYDAKVAADNFKIAPGQAFFVEAKENGNVVFNANNQHQNADTFQRSVPLTKIYLEASNGNQKKYTKVYYTSKATKGFDNGYDGTLFNSFKNDFEIYTQLPTVINNNKYQVQSVPDNNYDNLVIPIGINAKANKTLVFSVNTENLPTGIQVYLEDKERKTFTNLSGENASYAINTKTQLQGIGRFYLHTKSSIPVVDSSENNLKVIKLTENTIQIEGINKIASLKVYNIQGKLLVNRKISNTYNIITLPKVTKGIYLVKVTSGATAAVKKIIL